MGFIDDLIKNAKNTAKNVKKTVVNPVVNDVNKAYNTVQAPVTGLVGAATVGADQLFNGGKNKQVLLQATKQALNQNVARSFVPQNVANGTATPLQFGQSFAKTGIQLAPYALGAGGGALTAKLGAQTAERLGGSLAARAAGQTARIGANAAVAAPTFAGINALQQGVDNGFTRFDPGQANIAGLQAGAMSAAGDLAPIIGKVLAKSGVAGAKATGRAIENASQAAHDRTIDSVASSLGQRINPHQNLFDDSLIKAAAPEDIKGAERYFNQLKKGKDIGSVTTTTNERGALEPVTKDGLQKYIAYKAAYDNIAAKTPQTNDFGGSNFTNNPYKNVPTNQIEGNVLKDALTAREMQKQGGYIGLPGSEAPQLPYGTESVQNSLTKGAKEGRQNISQELASRVQGEHVVRNTEALNQRGIQAAQSLDSPTLFQQANDRMQVKQGTISDEDVSFINQAIERADREGNFEEGTNLHDQLAEHLVANGQTSQAAILLYNRSPQGLFNKAVKDINKGTEKGHVTPELRKELQGLADNIKNAPNQDAKEIAVAKLAQRVQKEVPNGKLQGALSVWKAGLLSGLKTHTGNVLSNATFAALKKVSDLPATAADAAIGAFTGKRTKAFTTEGLASGFGQGIKRGAETLTTGIDRRNLINGKYEGHGELHFKNKFADITIAKPTNTVFRALGASDQPFYYAAYRNSLFEQAAVAAKNDKLRGQARSSFIEQFAKEPPKSALQLAENDAKKAVLGEDNRVANALSSFTQKVKPAQAVIPFTKVPTNFLSQVLDYTPVGPIKEAVRQITNKKGFDQRSLAEALGKGATGTGLIYLGAQLANNNMLSGQYPSDPKEQARWKAEGITPNSVKLGGQWLSLNYLGPVGILFQAGKDFTDAAKRGDDAAVASIAGVGKSLTGQSFLTGFSSLANALNDPQRFGANFVNSQAGSVVPAAINDIANATDPLQRQANNLLQTVQSRIPGARQQLNQKQDVYGNGLTQRTDPFNLTVNPLRNSDQIDSPTLSEVRRLHNVDPNNTDLQVTPTPLNKSVKVDGKDVKLTDQQRYDLQNQIGQATQTNWGKLIQTPEYQALSDLDKAKALNNVRTDTAANTQRAYIQSNGLATYAKDLTQSQKDLQSSGSLSDYTKSKDSSVSKTSSSSILDSYKKMSTSERTKAATTQNDFEYKYELAKYQNDKANGTLSTAQDYRAQSNLAKAKVGADFSKDTRDLYSLSKTQLSAYLAQSPNGSKEAAQILAYGDALEAAGISKNKFRSSTGSVAITPTKKSSSRGSSSSATKSIASYRKQASLASRSNEITTTAKLANIAKSAKLSSSKTGFTNKVKKTGLRAYSKGNTQKVTVKKA